MRGRFGLSSAGFVAVVSVPVVADVLTAGSSSSSSRGYEMFSRVSILTSSSVRIEQLDHAAESLEYASVVTLGE